MDKCLTENIFRLSVNLYRGQHYNLSRKNIIIKVLETVFINTNNKEMSIFEITETISKLYKLTFLEEEIKSTIQDNIQYFIVNRIGTSNIFKYKLSNQRFEYLKKFENRSIDYFIDLFIDESNYKEKKEIKELLYKFFYNSFTTNLQSYKLFLNLNEKDSYNINKIINQSDYTEDEKEIINDFLKFNNSSKDKAIFDLINLSLEYCLINAKDNSIYIDGIKNKILYLDSNIIYRAIGINGNDRKEAMKKFFTKCVENNIEIRILSSTDREFVKSIDYNLKKIDNLDSGYINQKVGSQYIINKDIYSFYYEWLSGRTNKDISLFKSYILSQYEKIKTTYKIKVDYKIKIEHNNPEYLDILSSIQSFESKIMESNSVVEYDAKMIYSVYKLRKERKELNRGVMETLNFIISSDQVLINWDVTKAKHYTPIILLPSQWLMFLLKTTSRTEDDDYTSFVNFLSLTQNSSNFTSEEIHAVLSGISEITRDFKNQNIFAKEIIENDILEIQELKNVTIIPEAIKHNSSLYVENAIEKKLCRVEDQNKELVNEQKKLFDKIETIKSNEEEVRFRKDAELESKNQVINLYEEKIVNSELASWKFIGLGFLILGIILSIPIILLFIFKDKNFNFMYIYIIPFYTNSHELVKEIISWLLTVVYLSVLAFLFKNSFERLLSPKARELKKQEIIEKIKIKNSLE